MAAVHATGLPAPNRSHFSAMEEVEDADPGSSKRSGWLNRLIGRNGTGSPVEAVQFGGGVPIAALAGPEPVLVTPNADSVTLSGTATPTSAIRRRGSITKMWGGVRGPLSGGVETALDVVDRFAPVVNGPSAPAHGAVYPSGSDLGQALASAARTIRADIGAEVITVDHGSWDHHAWIGRPDNGLLRTMADEFARSLAAFLTDLGSLADIVTVVTVSEFGRRVKENASQGLDHGYGNVMLLVGAGVNGGRYYGTWPGLTDTTDADLLVTTDYRSVLSEIVTSRFGASTAEVFPRFSPEAVGVMQGA